MAAFPEISRRPHRPEFLLRSRTADARRPPSFAIPLLAGSSARRNPVQAVDRNRDPGHRPLDHHDPPEPRDPGLPVGRWPRRYRPPGRRNRFCRVRHCARRHRWRHRPLGRLDVRIVRFLRAVLPQRAGLARAGRDRRDARRGAAARRDQRLLVGYLRLRAFITHADHADHLPLRLRSAAVRLFQQDRGRLSRFTVMEFYWWRRCPRRTQRRADLCRRRHIRSRLPDPVAAGLAHHRDRWLALGV